jgi:hypothetical protein
MKYNCIILVVTLCLFFSNALRAGGFPVYSALEHANGLLTQIEVLQDALVQLDQLGISTETLVTEIEGLVLQYEEFEQKIRNAERTLGNLAHIDDLEFNEILYRLRRTKDKFADLDPNNEAYDDVVNETLDVNYGLGEIEGREELSGNMVGGVDIFNDSDQFLENKENLKNEIKRNNTRSALTRGRNESINKYAKDIDSLGSDALNDTMIHNAYQTNLLLKQQEEIIDRLEAIDNRELTQKLAEEKKIREYKQKDANNILRIKNRKPYGTHLK